MSVNISVDFTLRTKTSLTLNDLIEKSGLGTRQDVMNHATKWYKVFNDHCVTTGRKIVSVEPNASHCHIMNPNDEDGRNFMDVGKYQAVISGETSSILRHLFHNASMNEIFTKSLYLYDMILDAKGKGHRIGALDLEKKLYTILDAPYPDGQNLSF